MTRDPVERLIMRLEDAGNLLLLMDDCKATKRCKCPRHEHLHQYMMRTARAVGEFRKATQ